MKPTASAAGGPAKPIQGSKASIAFPDVCKTPTPAGPIPIPYANLIDAQANGGSEEAKIKQRKIIDHASRGGFNAKSATQAAIKSAGDEAGRIGGVKSAAHGGNVHSMMYSFDVKIEGQPVARHTDLNKHGR